MEWVLAGNHEHGNDQTNGERRRSYISMAKRKGKVVLFHTLTADFSYVSCIEGVMNDSWHGEVFKSMDLEWR